MKFLPLLSILKGYNKNTFTGDLSAGLTVGVMLVPQGMAYAMLAGLPPIFGLYASTIPLIIYAFFGSSRQLAVGPVAMVALLIASGVGALAEIGSGDFISLAILLSLMVGVFQLLLGLLRMGFLVNFLSHPVIAGFTSAAAVIIGFSQLKHLLGINIPRAKVHETLFNVYTQLSEVNVYTFLIGLGSILVIVGLKRISKRIPSPLVVVLLGLGAVQIFGLDDFGVAIVGSVPAGAPSFTYPNFNYSSFKDLLPIALTIALVGFMESIAVAKAIQNKHKNYQVSSNQELIALGSANIIGSFFQAFPTTGGFSRTAVNDQAGAKTGVASIIAALLVLLTLVFLTSYFYYLPKAVLAGIIMVAVFGLIDFKEAKHLWRTDKRDFSMFVLTALATLWLGVEEGILAGVVVSVLLVLVKVAYPHIAELGLEKSSGRYLNVNRFQTETTEDVLIVRLDAQLFFANIAYFFEKLKEMEAKKPRVKRVVLDATAINQLDSSAVHALSDAISDYQHRGIDLYIVGAKGPIRDILHKTGLVKKLGAKYFALTIKEAVMAGTESHTLSPEHVRLQSN